MYKNISIHVVLCIVLVPMAFSAEIIDDIYEYRLGPDDVVNISIEYIPEISRSYTISDRGEIVFPTLLPSINVKGLTAVELKNKLTEILREYISIQSFCKYC